MQYFFFFFLFEALVFVGVQYDLIIKYIISEKKKYTEKSYINEKIHLSEN